MAWTYSDYRTYDYGSGRLSRFRLHVQEVSDRLTAELAGAGNSKSTRVYLDYLAQLGKQAPDEERLNGQAAGTALLVTRGVPRL